MVMRSQVQLGGGQTLVDPGSPPLKLEVIHISCASARLRESPGDLWGSLVHPTSLQQLKRGALVAFNRQPISKIFTSFLLENPFRGFWMLLERFLHVSGGSAASHGLLPIILLLSHKPLDSK